MAEKERPRLSRIHAVDAAGDVLRVSGLSEARLRQSACRVLRENVLCSIATVTRGHGAHVNTAYFAFSDAFELFFLSHPRSRHGRNLAGNPSIAVAVFSTAQRWTDPGRGLQLLGRCHPAAGRHLEAGDRLYSERFPAYAKWKETAAKTIGARYRLYRCVASTLKIHDEREFGDGVFVQGRVHRGRSGRRRGKV